MIALQIVYGISIIFAILFVLYYLRILNTASAIGPEPVNLILLALGFALIASYILIEFVNSMFSLEFLLHVEKFYFFIGNFVIFYVLYRFTRELE